MRIFKKAAFKLASLTFRIRDLFIQPGKILEEAGIKEGQIVLDYGCGPGSYSTAAAKLVGDRGKVYAVDVEREAINSIIRAGKSHPNIEAILTNCDTGLPNKSVDAVFLFDVYHNLTQPRQIMEELHRVLKDEGILLFSDHHMKSADILREITNSGLFKLSSKARKTFSFIKTN